MSGLTKIELRPAYLWTCEECGRDNFCRGIVAELSEEEIALLREEHGIEDHETGDWMRGPDRVTCLWCGATFETLAFGEEDEL